MDGYGETWESYEKRRRTELAVKKAVDDAEYDREQEEQKRVRAERAAREALRAAEDARNEANELISDAQDAIDALHEELQQERELRHQFARILDAVLAAGEHVCETCMNATRYQTWEEARRDARELLTLHPPQPPMIEEK